jgi:hypothetical protein
LSEYVRTSVLKMEAVSFFERLVLRRKVSDLYPRRLLPTDTVRARRCIQTLAQSVFGDAAVQVAQWRRTGRAAGVTSSESEDRDRQS